MISPLGKKRPSNRIARPTLSHQLKLLVCLMAKNSSEEAKSLLPDEAEQIESLLSKARRGDERGRDELFNACRDYLNFLARAQVHKKLQSKIDASDIVQVTLLEAYRDFNNFQGNSQGEWLAWLRRILARNATDYVRCYKGTAKRDAGREVAIRHPSDATDVMGAAEPAAADASPSQQAIRRDQELRLTAALAELSEDHRQVILLRNIERLPFDQVAEKLNRSRPAAQMLWMRAIQSLQKIMDE